VLSVAFATRDRAATLERVLTAFGGLAVPEGGWQLIVVDNGSTDATPAVLARHAGRLPLQVIEEPRAGKNRALNRAIAHFAGDLVVLTDDDVLPDADWLVQLAGAAARYPEATLFGGTIRAAWPGPPPRWLRADAVNFGVLYALLERAAGECDHHGVFGPNMTVRRHVFTEGFEFNPTVGPDASDPHYPMGGETAFIGRLFAAGYRARFVPEARVQHIIRPEQLTEAWILGRAWRCGLGSAISDPAVMALSAAGLAARLAAARAAAAVARPMPASALRLRLLFRERFLAGIAASGAQRATFGGPLAAPAIAQGP
jgi:glycosyltransferase involved in cell wall biosynthesis